MRRARMAVGATPQGARGLLAPPEAGTDHVTAQARVGLAEHLLHQPSSHSCRTGAGLLFT